MSNDKVINGTPKGFASLCSTCRRAQVIRGLNMQQRTFCSAGSTSMAVTFPVESCSAYDDKRIPALYQMEEIAWQVRSRNRGPVGFGGEHNTEIKIEPPDRQSPQPTLENIKKGE